MKNEFLLETLKVIKEKLSEPKEELLTQLSKQYDLPYSFLYEYYELVERIVKDASSMTKAGDRKWSDDEHLLLSKLLSDLKGVMSKNKVFELLSPILDRTQGGISFYYYHGYKDRVIEENMDSTPEEPEESNEDDLFYNLETIAKNMEDLQGFDLEGLFKSLARLSILAAENQNQAKVEELEEELALKEATVLAYEKKLYEKDIELSKKENELFQMNQELNRLKEIVQNFENLSNGKKLSKLREYSTQIKELILKDEIETA